jgi:hypothetical protein
VRFLQVFATAIDLGERVSVKGLLHVWKVCSVPLLPSDHRPSKQFAHFQKYNRVGSAASIHESLKCLSSWQNTSCLFPVGLKAIPKLFSVFRFYTVWSYLRLHSGGMFKNWTSLKLNSGAFWWFGVSCSGKHFLGWTQIGRTDQQREQVRVVFPLPKDKLENRSLLRLRLRSVLKLRKNFVRTLYEPRAKPTNVYGCPSGCRTKSRKKEVTDAFRIPFHTDLNEHFPGLNNVNASYYRFLLSDGHPYILS